MKASEELATQTLENERALHHDEMALMRRELEMEKTIAVDEYATKLEASEERYRAAIAQVSELEGLLIHAQEQHEVRLRVVLDTKLMQL